MDVSGTIHFMDHFISVCHLTEKEQKVNLKAAKKLVTEQFHNIQHGLSLKGDRSTGTSLFINQHFMPQMN